MLDNYIGIRISEQRLYICDYEYNSKTKQHIINDYFYIDYDFSYKGVNVKELAARIKEELVIHKCKAKKLKFFIASHAITIETFDFIKQKNYMSDLKVLKALNRKSINIGESVNNAMAYTPINEYSSETETKNGKKKQIPHTVALTYSTPTEIFEPLKNIAADLRMELVSIEFVGNSLARYYERFYKNPDENTLLVHITDEYTIISIFQNGTLKEQKIDNFGYSTIQSSLSMYKNSLKYATDSIESTITAINTIKLYTVEAEVLQQIPTFNSVEVEQILEAKQTLINTTLDFLDRLKLIIQDETKNDNQITNICLYNDNKAFPDLCYTVQNYIGIKTVVLNPEGVSIAGLKELEVKNHLLSILGAEYHSVNLDETLLLKQAKEKTQSKVLYTILGSTLSVSLLIVGLFLFSYMRESDKNVELHRLLNEAEAAQQTYQQYISITNAYDTLVTFDDGVSNDLSNLAEQLTKIASVIPKDRVVIETINATAGEGTSQGSLTLSVVADSKQDFAYFIVGLESIEDFVEIENTSVTDNLGEGSTYFDNQREVHGTIVCKYVIHETPAPAVEQSSEDASLDNTSDTDTMGTEDEYGIPME